METREADVSDAGSIAAIYNHYVRTSAATFEEAELSQAEMATRVEAVRSADLPWYLATSAQTTLGYAYATPWKARSAYRYSAEVTVYVAPNHFGEGIGTALYQLLMPVLQRRRIHTALAGIALPNAASIALHERCGFRKAAHLTQVGFKMNRWIDVGYWQWISEDVKTPRISP